MTIVLKAKDYATRSDLETKVRNTFDLTPDKKDARIDGTREELARLQLSDRSIFWGIPCKITDTPTEIKTQKEPVQRGETFESSINLQVKPKKKNG